MGTSLSQYDLTDIGTIEFKNAKGNTTSIVFPEDGRNSPTIGGKALAYGYSGKNSFASLLPNCAYGGMTMSLSDWTALPTPPSESDSVNDGMYRIIALGGWAMIGGWIGFSKISSAPKTYQFSFQIPASLVGFASNPSVCIQEEDGFGGYSGNDNWLNTTYASCTYNSTGRVLTMKITKYAIEAGHISFFITGEVK